jgi:beta-galactosidase
MLYSADDALLQRIADYVHNGGHVLMTFKSGFTNENSVVRHELAPGPLRDAAGFTYQEFSNLENPLPLRGDPFHVGDANRVGQWAEFLQTTSAQPLAFYDHPFFGQWPAITRNNWGKGLLTYEGTALSPELQQHVVLDTLRASRISVDSEAADSPVRIKRGTNSKGKLLTYLLNYSTQTHTVHYQGSTAMDLLTGRTVQPGQALKILPWDLMILEE